MALNALSYGLPGAGDGIGEEIDAAWWTTYEGAQKDREFRGLNKPEYDHSKWRPMTSMAPSFYRVVECSENVVVVEVGHDFTKAGGETASMTIPLYWRDGDWIPDLTGQAGVTLSNPVPFNPADPAPLKKVNYS